MTFVIAFHTETFNVRGTCVAIYDYAHYAQLWYGITPIIIAKRGGEHSLDAIRRFRVRFQIDLYDDDIDIVLDKYNVDAVYTIIYGAREPKLQTKRPLCVQCAFCMWNPYGDIYIAVSKWVASLEHSPSGSEYVPHMITLQPLQAGITPHFRRGIPDDALVFGRIGGADVFNFGLGVISTIVRERDDVWFLLMNVYKWDIHPRIIVVEPTSNLLQKQHFIASCDAMIVPETCGHTFGISIAEFCYANKPIICLELPPGPLFNRQHLDELGEKAHIFHNEAEFHAILSKSKEEIQSIRPTGCYSQYRPRVVMEKFNRIVIDPLRTIARDNR